MRINRRMLRNYSWNIFYKRILLRNAFRNEFSNNEFKIKNLEINCNSPKLYCLCTDLYCIVSKLTWKCIRKFFYHVLYTTLFNWIFVCIFDTENVQEIWTRSWWRFHENLSISKKSTSSQKNIKVAKNIPIKVKC